MKLFTNRTATDSVAEKTMLNTHEFFTTLASQSNGNYIEYSHDCGIMQLQMGNGRFQYVKGYFQNTDQGTVKFMSKICDLAEYPDVDLKKLLSINHNLNYSKVVIDQEFLEVEATARYDLSTTEEISFIVQEVAEAADNLEFEITGKDIY